MPEVFNTEASFFFAGSVKVSTSPSSVSSSLSMSSSWCSTSAKRYSSTVSPCSFTFFLSRTLSLTIMRRLMADQTTVSGSCPPYTSAGTVKAICCPCSSHRYPPSPASAATRLLAPALLPANSSGVMSSPLRTVVLVSINWNLIRVRKTNAQIAAHRTRAAAAAAITRLLRFLRALPRFFSSSETGGYTFSSSERSFPMSCTRAPRSSSRPFISVRSAWGRMSAPLSDGRSISSYKSLVSTSSGSLPVRQ